MNPKDLKDFVENNPKLVTRKESKNYPGFFVLKYSKKVFFDNLWHKSAFLQECRGLVVDADYNVVVKPFTKVFNYGENDAGSTWGNHTPVLIPRKVNGFLGVVTRHNDEVIISTTGSLDSDFVGYARKYLSGIKFDMLRKHHSYLFEIVHPDDPHIIPEPEGAHFLAIVAHDLNEHFYSFDKQCSVIQEADAFFAPLGIHIEEKISMLPFSEVKQLVKECKHEGFVILNPATNETIKMKSPWYLANKAIARKVDILSLNKERVDEEFYGIIDKIKSMKDEWDTMEEQNRLKFIRAFFETAV